MPPLVAGSTQQLGALRFQLPAAESTRMMRIQFALRRPDGVELARNVLDLQTYPRAARQAPLDEVVTVIARERQAPLIPHAPALPDPASLGGYDVPQAEGMDPERTATAEDSYAPLDTLLERAGYRTTEELDLGIRLAISNYPTPELLQWVRDGGDLLFISEGYSPFFWVQSRSAAYSGNWITSYSWLRPEAHPRLPHSNPLGLAFTNLMLQSTILGLPMEDPAVQSDILAGMVSGWIHHPAAHTVQFRYGKGRVVMTTFRLRSALGYDPTAIAMLHDLVEHLHSNRCQPTVKANF